MRTKPIFLACVLILLYYTISGQVGIGTQSPDSSALLDLNSPNKGLLVPRLTTSAQTSIKNPAAGLLIFNLDFLKFYYFDGQQWLSLSNNTGDTLKIWNCGDSVYYSGKNYPTIQIGTQCWLQQNINAGTMINGGADAQNNSIIEKYCYNDDPVNCDVLGGLYSWDEMMQYSTDEGVQGICPYSWFLPTDAAWSVLVNFLGGEDVAGGKMKEAGLVHWGSPNTGATNESGFTALPGGRRNYDGAYAASGILGDFWSSTLNYPGNAWSRELNRNFASVARSGNSTSTGLSVRCVGGTVYEPPQTPSNPFPGDGSTFQPVNADLSWACSDPENSHLTFDIYFDTQSTPELVQSNVSSFTYDPGPLDWATTYYWKIVANDPGNLETEGPVWSFTTLLAPGADCPGDATVLYGGYTYHTVQVGDQCWLRENLNIGTMIPDNTGQSDNDIIEKYCYLNNEDSCDVYGGLYQWNEMKQYIIGEGARGICPEGWYVPTDAEWAAMISFLGGETVAGGKMKEAGLAHWTSPNTGATNESGFTALPGGWRNFSEFANIRAFAFYWGARRNTGTAWYQAMRYDNENIPRNYTNEVLALSVRCIRAVIPPPPPPAPCPEYPSVIYEGKTYQTVQVGEQCWLAENLDAGEMIPGNSNQTDNSIIEKYCYDDDASNCTIYGGLYRWGESMQYSISEGARGICPENWHIPASADWWALFNYLGGDDVAGGKLKESGTGHWFYPNTGATNESVFTALPGGKCDSGNFFSEGQNGHFWSSTPYSETFWVWALTLFSGSTEINWDFAQQENYAFSVRCIHD